MAQIKNLIARWDAAWPSPMIISRQYDNCQFRIDLMNYPEPEYIVDEQTEQMEILSYYLIVWMKETEDGEYREMSPIMLPGPYWIVPNYYTQLVQDIRFQFCVQSDSTDYEAHSAIFTGRIVDSIEHDGTAIDVIPVEMFDAYKAYIQEIAMAAGAVVIDPNLDTAGAAADAKAAGDAIKAVQPFVVQVPGSAAVYSGSITSGDFARALAAYTAGSGVYAVKDSEIYQLSAAGSSTMTFTQMYHGTMNFIKQIVITSEDTFTVTNTALSSSAEDTSYSNTASGLAATNVQGAVDELSGDLSETNERLGDLEDTVAGMEGDFSQDVKDAILACFRDVVWASESGADSYNALYLLLSGESVRIVNNLVNCATDNDAVYAVKGDSYTAHITSKSAYALSQAQVSVVMNGVDITETVYSNGTINIPALTGKVVITAKVANGYTLYDYVGADKLPAIDGIIFTDVQLSSRYTLDAKFMYRKAGSSPFPFMGTRDGWGTKDFGLFITPSTAALGYWLGGYEYPVEGMTGVLVDGVPNHVVVNPVGKSADYPAHMTLTINGTEYDTEVTNDIGVYHPWFGLFGYARSATAGTTTVNSNISPKIGEFAAIDESGNLVYDLIPATVGELVGFYDVVNGKFYNNTLHTYYAGNWE